MVLGSARIAGLEAILRVALKAGGVEQARFVADAADALQCMALSSPQAVVVQMDEVGFDIVCALRDRDACPNPYVPILGVCSEATRTKVNAVINAGVHELVTLPLSPQMFWRRMNAAVHVARPFIALDSYFGPCRRRHNDPAFGGPERRASARTATRA